MSDYVSGQKSIAATFNSDIEVITPDLQKIQFDSSGQLQLNRPNKIHASRTRPVCLDLLNRSAAEAIYRHAGLTPPDSPWVILAGFEDNREAVHWQVQQFTREVGGQGQLEASAHGRMERLLRQTGVPACLLFNGRVLRLVSAPRGESSGWLDFRVADMVQTAGRPISTALRLLLGQPRLLSLPRSQRLSALLEGSRKFQNEVSERLEIVPLTVRVSSI